MKGTYPKHFLLYSLASIFVAVTFIASITYAQSSDDSASTSPTIVDTPTVVTDTPPASSTPVTIPDTTDATSTSTTTPVIIDTGTSTPEVATTTDVTATSTPIDITATSTPLISTSTPEVATTTESIATSTDKVATSTWDRARNKAVRKPKPVPFNKNFNLPNRSIDFSTTLQKNIDLLESSGKISNTEAAMLKSQVAEQVKQQPQPKVVGKGRISPSAHTPNLTPQKISLLMEITHMRPNMQFSHATVASSSLRMSKSKKVVPLTEVPVLQHAGTASPELIHSIVVASSPQELIKLRKQFFIESRK